MKFLITGGAGFIGSHLAKRLLAEGCEVTILDNFNDFYDPAIKEANVAALGGGVEVVRADICDAQKVDEIFSQGKFDGVVHLAARAGVRPSVLNPRLYIETNIVGTQTLLDAARAYGVGKFVFASSSSVYGFAPKVPFREDMALLQTLSPYAATKIAAEHLCGNYSSLYGLCVVCLRFFTVYGPGQRPDLAIHKFTDHIWRGEKIQQFGDGSTRRDYTYIDDIVQGILGGIAYDAQPYDIFNLGENQTTTLLELIATIEAALGKKAIIEKMPPQEGDMPLTCADISKAQRLLGYNPKTKIAEGIPKFVEWFLAKV